MKTKQLNEAALPECNEVKSRKKRILIYLLFFCITSFSVYAQEGVLKGVVTDSLSNPVPFVSIMLEGNNIKQTAFTDELGNFKFTKLAEAQYQIIFFCMGYERKIITADVKNDKENNIPLVIKLNHSTILLSEVEVTGSKNIGQTMNSINSMDLLLRPVNSAQDLMKLVPGLFIAQHQGGGKAEQIFLRGFDCDHGTDFAVFWDGIPVNMPSHAHGQGYADDHFMIPETIDQLDVFKGTYNTMFGDFATTGVASFTTKDFIDNMIKVEYGNYGYDRMMGVINLIGKDKHFLSKYKENAYISAEQSYNAASYFVNPQNYKRFTVFGKYYGQLSPKTTLTFEGSYFNSAWYGSGQVPARAITEGLITRFGALDPSEGGQTDRTNVNAILKTTFDNGGILKNQVYYSYYQLNLFTDFTFFLVDSIHGDGINQWDKGRNICGYNGSYELNKDLWGNNLKSVIGLTTRIDDGIIGLRHQEQRVILDTATLGRLYEQNACLYVDETYNLSSNLVLNAGCRADIFYYNYSDVRGEMYDSLDGTKTTPKISPKLNLYYNLNPDVQFFIRSGYGFHSNDARVVVTHPNVDPLPTALGYEIGSTFKPIKSMMVNAALWGIHLQNELTYDQDVAQDVINGPTQRYGADLSIRQQIAKVLFFDIDLNYSHGRFTDSAKGKAYIPLAPTFTSVAGLTVKSKKFSCSLRYRYIDNRPANNENTVVALGYFLMDAVAKYRLKRYEFSVTVQNIFNVNWNEAEFDTTTRLKVNGVLEPVGGYDDLCFTPGAPRLLRGSICYYF
jgi:hypothetical protein